MSRIQTRTLVLCGGLALAVLLAYANHFQNDFHFDDFHTVTNNPYIRSLHYIPRYFVDPLLFSTLPDHATYRPLVSTSLAIDYWLAHGFNHFPYHFSTFIWFLVQLVLMFFLFRRIMDAADPHPSNIWTALLATACYGLHPANAETVNYVIQRGDLYNTLGIVASLLWFAAYPAQRKHGWYLLPAVAAYLSKAPALIYPLILLAYVWLFETGGDDGKAENPREVRSYVARATLPAFLVTLAATALTAIMTPKAYNPGATSGSLYRLTQPWVALHYFKVFFLPNDLSADTDWGYIKGLLSVEAIAGFLFVIVMLAMAFYSARRRETRPIAFGILWFFLALLPTSLLPLAEVTNDHRMFFPFVGLALAVFWALRLVLFQETARLTLRHSWVRGAIGVLAVIFTAEAAGTHQRNIVWRTDASLWHDVTIKSPKNGRGLMNYGITFIPRDYNTALNFLLRADRLLPNYYYVHLNMGITYAGLGRDQEAEQHFQRAIAIAAGESQPHIYYAYWLRQRLRLAEAGQQLEVAVKLDHRATNARHILMEMYSQGNKQEDLARMIRDTLAIDPRDPVALAYQRLPPGTTLPADKSSPETGPGGLAPALQALFGGTAAEPHSDKPTAGSLRIGPEAMLNISAGFINAHKYEEALAAAKKAVELRPLYAEAFNNMAVAYFSLQMWNEGIQAAEQAVQIKPNYQEARDNLQFGQMQKQKLAGVGR